MEHLHCHEVITACSPQAPKTAGSVLEGRDADFLRNEKTLAELSLRVYLLVVGTLPIRFVAKGQNFGISPVINKGKHMGRIPTWQPTG